MKHYWLITGTTVARWDGFGWFEFVTTKDAYYTEEDIIKDEGLLAGYTRLKVPDLDYYKISTPTNKLVHVCARCLLVLYRGNEEDVCSTCREYPI